MIQRLNHLLRHRDEGVTLVEVMVVAFLSAIIMAVAGSMFVAIARQTVTAQGVRLSTADASNIVNVVTTTIRASIKNAVQTSATPDPAIVSGKPMSLTIISYTDAGPSFETPLQLRYSITNGRMVEDRWKPSIVGGYAVFPAVTTTPYSHRILGNVVVNASDDPVFRYYAADGHELIPAATGLSAADRAIVTSIRFHVKVQAFSSNQVVELDNNVGMPNMNIEGTG
jgi:hypothetical protein